MTDETIHDNENPDGSSADGKKVVSLPLTEGAIRALDVLAAMTAADGTSYLDIFNDTRDLD
ncbi:hypothetical protein [Streptomyces acidicola]|uniref:Uncharacterized protein n=1 Tax=Streptomyces acidicola TaxID=2596892 RepID=A0A5N8WKX2_9ACTN|nr:hypothetical protein [Streptomyces acidicola]MPY47138.1 hypothetical protein [Streptomyces acidicola]MPY47277.1 hypothetical protein [Streptomyces acidicola]